MMDGRKLAVHVESPAEAEAEGQDRPGSPPPLVLDRSLMREFDAVLERLDGIVDMDRSDPHRSDISPCQKGKIHRHIPAWRQS